MLSEAEKVACLEVLYRALVFIRSAADSGDGARAAMVANALHNLPHFIAGTLNERTIAEFRTAFLGRMAHASRGEGGRDFEHILEPLRNVG
jgi:hypothetical protein